MTATYQVWNSSMGEFTHVQRKNQPILISSLKYKAFAEQYLADVSANQRHASGRKLIGILSSPAKTRSAITSATLGAMPKPILKPPFATN